VQAWVMGAADGFRWSYDGVLGGAELRPIRAISRLEATIFFLWRGFDDADEVTTFEVCIIDKHATHMTTSYASMLPMRYGVIDEASSRWRQ